MKSIKFKNDEYIVRKHELHMKKASKLYVAQSSKQLLDYMQEKGLI